MAEIEMHGGSNQEVAEWHIRQAMLGVVKFERYSSYEALADWKKELVQQESHKERTCRLAEDWLETEDKIEASGLDAIWPLWIAPFDPDEEGEPGPFQLYLHNGVKNEAFKELLEFQANKKRIEVRVKNNNIRLDNAHAWHVGGKITPMLNPATGDAIENCPATFSEICSLSSSEATRILKALQESVPKTLDAKREKVMGAVGGRGPSTVGRSTPYREHLLHAPLYPPPPGTTTPACLGEDEESDTESGGAATPTRHRTVTFASRRPVRIRRR